jgi:drug/metabolite transporter (DMT)-like permease
MPENAFVPRVIVPDVAKKYPVVIAVQPLNALAPMLVTALGIIMLLRPLHPLRALTPMLFTLVGIVKLVRPVQPLSALSEILVIALLIVMLVNPAQL